MRLITSVLRDAAKYLLAADSLTEQDIYAALEKFIEIAEDKGNNNFIKEEPEVTEGNRQITENLYKFGKF